MVLNPVCYVALCAVVLIGGPQQKPDFTGTWRLDAKARMDFGFASAIGGSVIRIEQNAGTIRIRRSYGRESIGNVPVVLTISLDGKDSPNQYHGVHRAGLTGAISSRARWDANRLVIVTTRILTDTDRKTSTRTETSETLSFDGPRLQIGRVVSPGAGPAQKELWFTQ